MELEVLLGERVRMWYLHDEAPPHFATPVTEQLNNHFPNHCIGRNGLVSWPQRSADLNPSDFCLCGWMKRLVYGNQQCSETIEEFEEQVEFVLSTGSQGQHFQHLW